MSEKQYEDHDTQPIKLPRKHRETFRDVPPAVEVSPWSPDYQPAQRSLFDLVNPDDQTALRYFETLEINEKLLIPMVVQGDEADSIPDTVRLDEYRVKSLGLVDDELKAFIVSPAGVEDFIPATIAPAKGALDFEARLLDSLANVSGLDIHDATQLIVETTRNEERK